MSSRTCVLNGFEIYLLVWLWALHSECAIWVCGSKLTQKSFYILQVLCLEFSTTLYASNLSLRHHKFDASWHLSTMILDSDFYAIINFYTLFSFRIFPFKNFPFVPIRVPSIFFFRDQTRLSWPSSSTRYKVIQEYLNFKLLQLSWNPFKFEI